MKTLIKGRPLWCSEQHGISCIKCGGIDFLGLYGCLLTNAFELVSAYGEFSLAYYILRWLRSSENSAICSLIFYRSASELILLSGWDLKMKLLNSSSAQVISAMDDLGIFFFHSWFSQSLNQLNWAFSLIITLYVNELHVNQWMKCKHF